jgi:hypothetical protein
VCTLLLFLFLIFVRIFIYYRSSVNTNSSGGKVMPVNDLFQLHDCVHLAVSYNGRPDLRLDMSVSCFGYLMLNANYLLNFRNLQSVSYQDGHQWWAL